MSETFLEKWWHRIAGAWGVLTGRYIAVHPEIVDVFMDPETLALEAWLKPRAKVKP